MCAYRQNTIRYCGRNLKTELTLNLHDSSSSFQACFICVLTTTHHNSWCKVYRSDRVRHSTKPSTSRFLPMSTHLDPYPLNIKPQISDRLTLTESSILLGMSTMHTPTLLRLILILATDIHCPATRSYLKQVLWYLWSIKFFSYLNSCR